MKLLRTLSLCSILAAPSLALAGSTPAPAPAAAAARLTKVTWHGQAAFEIVTPSGKVLLIDPWLQNPLNPTKNPVEALKKADYILVTHGHFDHVGDAVAIGKKTGARLIASFELGQQLAKLAGYPEKQLGYDTLGNAGGELAFENGEFTVAFVPAVHSSGLDVPDASGKGTTTVYGGNPVGYVVKIKGGPTIYHTGDTAYYCDMSQIGDMGIDLALINIGGHFGMEPEQAAQAARAVKPKLVVPHHFKSFPILTQDTKGFFGALDKLNIAHQEMKPGETITFDGKNKK